MSVELDKKQIRKRAKEILKTGIPKQEAYEQLAEEFQNRAATANVIRRLPSALALKKYGIWNHVLLGLLILTASILLLVKPSFGTALWYGLLIIAVARKTTRFYYWVTIMSALGVIGIIAAVLMNEATTEGWIRIGFFLALVIPSCILPIWLMNKLTPAPEEEREYYENENGEQRSWMKPVFKE